MWGSNWMAARRMFIGLSCSPAVITGTFTNVGDLDGAGREFLTVESLEVPLVGDDRPHLFGGEHAPDAEVGRPRPPCRCCRLMQTPASAGWPCLREKQSLPSSMPFQTRLKCAARWPGSHPTRSGAELPYWSRRNGCQAWP